MSEDWSDRRETRAQAALRILQRIHFQSPDTEIEQAQAKARANRLISASDRLLALEGKTVADRLGYTVGFENDD